MTDLADAALNNELELEVAEYRETMAQLEARLRRVEAERDRYADWLAELLRAAGLADHPPEDLGWQVEHQLVPMVRRLRLVRTLAGARAR